MDPKFKSGDPVEITIYKGISEAEAKSVIDSVIDKWEKQNGIPIMLEVFNDLPDKLKGTRFGLDLREVVLLNTPEYVTNVMVKRDVTHYEVKLKGKLF